MDQHFVSRRKIIGTDFFVCSEQWKLCYCLSVRDDKIWDDARMYRLLDWGIKAVAEGQAVPWLYPMLWEIASSIRPLSFHLSFVPLFSPFLFPSFSPSRSLFPSYTLFFLSLFVWDKVLLHSQAGLELTVQSQSGLLAASASAFPILGLHIWTIIQGLETPPPKEKL